MPYTSALDAAAARRAISQGDDTQLERYLREGGHDPVQNITAATATLIFGTNTYNRGAGIVGTLPLATGSMGRVRVVIGTLVAGTTKIQAGRAADMMAGSIIGATATAGAGIMIAATYTGTAGTSSDTITMNGSTTGGGVGSQIILTDIAPNLWLIEGNLVTVGALTTPFSSAV
jgi:hypothetical protein